MQHTTWLDFSDYPDETVQENLAQSPAKRPFAQAIALSTSRLSNGNTWSKRQKRRPRRDGLDNYDPQFSILLDDEDDENAVWEEPEGGLYVKCPPLVYARVPVLHHSMQKPLDVVDLTEAEGDLRVQVITDEDRSEGITHTVLSSNFETRDFLMIDPFELAVRNPIRLDGVTYAAGKTIEFKDGTFLRIKTIHKRSSDAKSLTVTGQSFVRSIHYGAKLPRSPNEVIWIGNLTKVVRAEDLARFRKLIMTNQTYPVVSTEDHPDAWRDRKKNSIVGPLFCRWRRMSICDGARLIGERWQSLYPEEADPIARIPEGAKRFRHQKLVTYRGGSHVEYRIVCDENGIGEEYFSQYTFGDAFCGAGGTSCGARMAGMRLAWAFDYDIYPILTYQQNFPEAECLELPVDQFINQANSSTKYRVDVLHISPPCQPFSPAHTVPSQVNDEKNQAAFFSVCELVKSVKPRIVTVEETEGLVSRHSEWFASLIHSFLYVGYSVTWKIIKCGDYGVPQLNRKRVMLIAAAPGEILPDFPAPTHAVNPSGTLKKIPTIGDLISNLDGLPNHNTTNLRRVPQPPFSPNSYAHTLTCNSGVGNYHPSGLRNYTVRELAVLQTFPRNFQFADVPVTRQKRQIGNAVPPELSKAVMEAVIKSLRRTDSLY